MLYLWEKHPLRTPMMPLLLCLIVACIAWLLLRKRSGATVTEHSPVRQSAFRPRLEVDVDRSEILRPPLVPPHSLPYYLVLDTETFDAIEPSSLDEQGKFVSPLVALSWQLTDQAGRPIREESLIVRQRGAMQAEAIAIHGITNEQMAQGIEAEDALRLLCQDLTLAETIVAHNAAFHLGIIRHELLRLGLSAQPLEGKPQICTMLWGSALGFKTSARGQALYPNLSELFAYLHYGRLHCSLRYTSKTLRDVRLCSACLRSLLLRHTD